MTLVEQLEAKHSECDALTAQLASAEEKLAAVETLNTDLASKVSALEADKTTFDAKLLEVTQASAAALDEEKAARVKIEGEHETCRGFESCFCAGGGNGNENGNA
jgi:chromosome segregation ATPase